MKAIVFPLLLILFLFTEAQSQTYFNKILTGPLVTTSNYSNIAAWGDYDNDGDPDVVISSINDSCGDCPGPLLMFNNDNGNFVRVSDNVITDQIVIGSGLCWVDYDNDGNLDLFVCGTYSAKNRLFHNDGSGQFTRIEEGILVNDITSSSQACAWGDYNKDGWLDVFVSNRFMSNFLYKNNGDGSFTKITGGNIVTDAGSSRSCAWGDYDNDGWPDLFVMNYEGIDDVLYKNDGDGTFTRKDDAPMCHDGLWGAACGWFDYNNDGWLDLYVTGNENRLYRNERNGNFTVINSDVLCQDASYGYSIGDYNNDGWTDLFRVNVGQINKLYRNNNGTFAKVNNEIPSTEGINSVAASMIDYNGNGKMDLFVTNRFNNLYNFLYENIGADNNYISLCLVGNQNKFGIGATLTVITAGNRQYKEVTAGSGWGSQNSFNAHFGIGNVSIIDTILVEWPSGLKSVMVNASPNQTLKFYETPNGLVNSTHTGGIIPDGFSLSQNYPNPFNPQTKIKYSIPADGSVSLIVYDILGNEISTLVNNKQAAGTYVVNFDISGKNISSGMYFYKLTSGNFTDTKKMSIIK